MRVDSFVAQQLPDVSRNMAQQLAEQGFVCRAGKELKKNDKVFEGDEIIVSVPEPEPLDAVAQDIPLDIVFEDADVIVINKPKGMVVHPAAGHMDGTLVNALLFHCEKSLSGIGGTLRPGIVHRIDKDTSGLLIVAKNDEAHQFLAAQLENHSLYREYDAVVYGNIKSDSGKVDAPIGRSPRDRKRMAVVPEGRRAVTHYTVVARYSGFTHVKCRLETGRTHQIRVHMAHIGHPVAGDDVYGNRADRTGLGSQCLHARKLVFVHPRTHEEIALECDLPNYFKAFIKKLEKKERR